MKNSLFLQGIYNVKRSHYGHFSIFRFFIISFCIYSWFLVVDFPIDICRSLLDYRNGS